MNILTINFNPNNSVPLYAQIYTFIKEEIENGTLPYNTKLPSTRSLSTHLQVSRNTVDTAYRQLLSEGYIESLPKKGYYVSRVEHIIAFNPIIEPLVFVKPVEKSDYKYDFSPSSIDLSNFPFNTWRKLMKNILSEDNYELFKSGNPQGDYELRVSIQNYLKHSRGVDANPEHIIIGAGADYLLLLLSRIIHENSVVAMENPTYKQAYKIIKGFGHLIVPISLDNNGIIINELKSSNANIVYVTPSHQYPMGIVMPINRRMALLTWANEDSNRYIIEDDHDSEFRYKGKPIPALAGIDSNYKTIYLGTFSRAIAPAIRVGYMVLPPSLMEVYRKEYSYYSSTVSRIDQAILTKFINGGYFERHLNKMRTIYKTKHDKMISILKEYSNFISILSESAGLHIVIQVNNGLTESELIDYAAQSSIKLYGITQYFIEIPKEINIPIILLGYGNMSEVQIEEGILRLISSWKEHKL